RGVAVRFAIPLFVVLFLLAAIALSTGRETARLAPPSALGAPAPAPALSGGAAPQAEASPPATPAPAAPAFAPAPAGQRPYVPILMYHYVRTVDPGVDPLGYGLSVTPAQLAAQLDWLRRAGYDTVQMSALAGCIRGESPCPARAVALTFDDGYMDAYTDAFPLLQQYGVTATFYIVSGFVGHDAYMGWGEIRALRDAGMEIGAHSISHIDLTTLSHDENVDQIGRSGAEIAAQLGAPVRSFCYPAGQFNAEIAAITRERGYTSATTTIQQGPQDDPFALPRLRIYGDMSQDGFQATVAAYLP
ncbi:polysaccharide deacetylase family protein, partial [Oscillochloris sp. ZM17-4]|uniref:polysaccharide deacetylase family protein n=1 Tax=Oscillochloris sp. ZM17-4 TaxID=2866714 RepID=UPI001C72AE2E